jgi:hypothetical protein
VYRTWWEDFRNSDQYLRIRHRIHRTYKNGGGEVYTKIGWQAAVEHCEDLLMDKCEEGPHQDCECIYCKLAEEIANKVRSM